MTWMVDQKSRRIKKSDRFWENVAAAILVFAIANTLMFLVVDAIMKIME